MVTLLLLLLLSVLYHHHLGLTRQVMSVSTQKARTLQESDLIGVGLLVGPEDIAYDPNSQLIYTGCADGWIKRVTMNESVADSVVRNWVDTGGRPIGLVLANHNEVIVADAYKGLLKVYGDGKMKHLTNEAEGLKFKLTDGVDVARNGTIYFTDASYKYSLKYYLLDFLEGKPHGRLMSYDPSTKQTKVLVQGLYFPNGVAVSPDQNFVIFCESPKRRCRKYFIRGKRLGDVDKFIDNLPAMPDNIKYDRGGHFWIALALPITYKWDLALRFPLVRNIVEVMRRYFDLELDGGVMAVDLEGKPIAYYHDLGLSLVSSGIEINNHVYCGSYYYPYIIRLNLTHQFPEHAWSSMVEQHTTALPQPSNSDPIHTANAPN